MARSLAATIDDIADFTWDVVIIGAGPAGSVAARGMALQGHKVLLVDRDSFPRYKVCGCCLNRRAMADLESIGLGQIPRTLGGVELKQFHAAAASRQAILPLPNGMAVSREAFDMALASEAVEAGAVFLQNTTAKLVEGGTESRRVTLRQNDATRDVQTKIVIAATGLSAHLPENLKSVPEANARVGAGVMLRASTNAYVDGTIYMACGTRGYVGLVRTGNGCLNIAAAFDVALVRDSGGLGGAAAQVMKQAGLPPVNALETAAWKGTPALTRRPPDVADHRLFLAGDAAGYIEPFTGEGMAWAIASAVALSELLSPAIEKYTPHFEDIWRARHATLVKKDQRICRAMAWWLRRPRLVSLAVRTIAAAPALASPILRRMNTSSRPINEKVVS